MVIMALDGILLIELGDRVVESVKQDQTAQICRLIFLQSHSKVMA